MDKTKTTYYFDAYETIDGEKYEFAVAVHATSELEAREQIKERYPDAVLTLTE